MPADGGVHQLPKLVGWQTLPKLRALSLDQPDGSNRAAMHHQPECALGHESQCMGRHTNTKSKRNASRLLPAIGRAVDWMANDNMSPCGRKVGEAAVTQTAGRQEVGRRVAEVPAQVLCQR